MKYLFIDESGDPGIPFKKDKKGKYLLDEKGKKIPTGASLYYIVSIVVLDGKQIATLEDEIIRLKQKFGYKKELKSTHVSLSLYRALLKTLVKHKIKIYFRAVNKEKYKGTFKTSKTSENTFRNVFDTYNVVKTISVLCKKEKLTRCEVVIDRAERRAFPAPYNFDKFNEYLRNKVNTRTIKRVHHITHANTIYVHIMQLSDLVCGALRDNFMRKNTDLKKIVNKQLEKVY